MHAGLDDLFEKTYQPDPTSSGSPGRIRYFATRRLDFGNNLSTFDWIFGATYLQEEPGAHERDSPWSFLPVETRRLAFKQLACFVPAFSA